MKKNRQQTQKPKMHSLELLAPAGTLQACKAAIHAGADAVYLGGGRFGARAYADNFTMEELLEAIDYAHLHKRKIYLTVNTLLKQQEIIDDLYPYLKPFYENGLDAVIIQDLGVMQFIRGCFPKLPIHISTQMSITGAHGAAYLKSLGASRIVTARELSLAEIQNIHKNVDIEIESFIHGALCYCYSGQCLFSSMLGGRSGNRGRCAQPCRLPYTVLDENRGVAAKSGSYPLSPKDLCTVHMIPELADAGVYSFKIEGRMKSAEYAAGVTAVYRKYIDFYLSGQAADVAVYDRKRLEDTGSRSGFTDGYYKQKNGKEMISMQRSEHVKNSAALTQATEQYMAGDFKIPLYAEIFLMPNEPAILTVTESESGLQGFAQADVVEAAKNQPLAEDDIIKQISKTGNTPFSMDSVTVTMPEAIFLPKQVLNRLRRDAVTNLMEQLLNPYCRKSETFPKPKKETTTFSTTSVGKKETTPFFTASIEQEEQLKPLISSTHLARIYLDSMLYNKETFIPQLQAHITRIHAAGKQVYFILPSVFRMYTAQFYEENWQSILKTGVDGFLVRTQDELGFLAEKEIKKECCILDHSLYTYSDVAKSAYAAAGWQYDTVPLELNKKELSARSNINSELVIYGRMSLMISAQCIRKNFIKCSKKSDILYLKDRYKSEFPVKNNCSECYNTIYNSRPLSLLQLADELSGLQAAAYRMQFTTENADMVRRITNCCKQAFFENIMPDMEVVTGGYTNGHYKRGVE